MIDAWSGHQTDAMRRRYPILHEPLRAKAEAEMLDDFGRESPAQEVGMIRIEILQRKVEWGIDDNLFSRSRLWLLSGAASLRSWRRWRLSRI